MAITTWKKQAYALSLLDEDFLATLLEQKEREIYARIASLDFDENPIEYIEGKVTGGNVNIDGDSAVRRTCSLTLIAEDVNIHDYYWGVRTKFKLEVGVRNELPGIYNPDNGDYPDIVWFPLGIYVISNFNTSLSVNSYTISITGKDKMCLLNGELGGQLFASIDFGKEEYKKTVLEKVNTTGVASSEILVGKTYYTSFVADDDEILETNEDYIFIEYARKTSVKQEDIANKYYKFENKYKKITENKIYSVIYVPFKLVKTPGDMFEPFSGTYEAGKYYYIKGSLKDKFYILDNGAQPSDRGGYYQFKDLYTVNYEYTIKSIPIEKIILESVHAYAKEPYHNIIINDLQNYGLEQITYKGDIPLVLFRNNENKNFTNIAFADRFANSDNFEPGLSFIYDANDKRLILPSGFDKDTLIHEITNRTGTPIYLHDRKYYLQRQGQDDIAYTIAIVNFGDDLGYRVTDLTYSGDLISNIGESLTSILDKVKQMLGDFEYFYDLEGHFVFQRKKTYVNTSWSQIAENDDEKYVTYANDKKKFSFNFEGNRLITAVQNTPVVANLKNDFVVWGKRTDVSGQETPIHARYAIDKKPTEYMTLRGILYFTEEAKNHPSDQYRDKITDAAEHSSYGYTKKTELIPQFLIDADPTVSATSNPDEKRRKTLWYELKDWSEYYFLATGAYPAQRMSAYQQDGGFVGSIDFPDNSTRNFRAQLIIDFEQVDKDRQPTDDPDKYVPYYRAGPFQHTYNGCGHTYTDFLNRYNTYPNMISYIYNPKLPSQEIIDADGGSIPVTDWKQVDWRELIYQMALDYFAGQGCSEDAPIYDAEGNVTLSNPDHFLATVAERNRDMYPSGYTGYEQYYTDMQGFWRELYNPDYHFKVIYSAGEYQTESIPISGSKYYTRQKVWSEKNITDVKIEYYINSLGDQAGEFSNLLGTINDSDILKTLQEKQQFFVSAENAKLGWNVNVFEKPETLNFWIEFFDSGDELSQFSISQVGDRTKVVNDDKVTAIVFKEVPDLILYDKNKEDSDEPNTDDLRLKYEEMTGYTWVFLPKGFSKYLTISYRNISAKNKIDDLLYQYAYCIENISITALPVYHLQPNTRIYVCDKTTNIVGEYIVSKISLPLTYNGTMSITATLAPERLY